MKCRTHQRQGDPRAALKVKHCLEAALSQTRLRSPGVSERRCLYLYLNCAAEDQSEQSLGYAAGLEVKADSLTVQTTCCTAIAETCELFIVL